MTSIYFYDATESDEAHLKRELEGVKCELTFIKEKIDVTNVDKDAEVLSVFTTSTITEELLEKMPKLKLIACRSTGYNNVPIEAAKARGVVIANVPTYGESTVAEYTFAMLLALTRRLGNILNAKNTPLKNDELVGTDVSGKVLGVIGTGHIGQKVIKIARGFGMNVLAYDTKPDSQLAKSLDFTYAPLDTLLGQSDVITLHIPLLPDTKHLLNSERIALMKSSAIIVNTARGELIETSALIEALENSQLAGAALDVIEGEALLHYDEEVALLRRHEIDTSMLVYGLEISLLQQMPNVIISPHNAYNTTEAVARINQTTAKNIIYFLDGRPSNIVGSGYVR